MITGIREHAEDWLFAPAATSSPTGWLRRILRYPYALLRDLVGGQLNLHAMGLVYQTLLALIPLLAFSFSILQAFGVHRELEPLIYEFFRPTGAAAGELTARVMQFTDKVHGSLVGSIGLALLIWTLVATLKKVEDSLNFIWHVEVPRSFTRRIAEYVGLLIIGPLLVGAVIGMSRLALANEVAGRFVALALTTLPYVVITALFTLLYVFIPNTRVRLRAAIGGGLAAGILWAAIGKLFTTLVVSSAKITIVYAGFTIVIVALIWTYLGWLILLIGAGLSFYLQNPSYLRLGLAELHLSGAETERLALAIMYLVAESHAGGTRRWRVNSLAARLGLPGIAVSRAAAALEGAGLLARTEDERFLPGRDTSHIRIEEIIGIARAHAPRITHTATATPEPVENTCRGIETAWRKACGDQTLKSLVDGRSSAAAHEGERD